jgi:hypothetical protein
MNFVFLSADEILFARQMNFVFLCRLNTLCTTDELYIFLFGMKAEAATATASSLQEATTAAASGLLEDRLTPPPTPVLKRPC